MVSNPLNSFTKQMTSVKNYFLDILIKSVARIFTLNLMQWIKYRDQTQGNTITLAISTIEQKDLTQARSWNKFRNVNSLHKMRRPDADNISFQAKSYTLFSNHFISVLRHIEILNAMKTLVSVFIRNQSRLFYIQTVLSWNSELEIWATRRQKHYNTSYYHRFKVSLHWVWVYWEQIFK